MYFASIFTRLPSQCNCLQIDQPANKYRRIYITFFLFLFLKEVSLNVVLLKQDNEVSSTLKTPGFEVQEIHD